MTAFMHDKTAPGAGYAARERAAWTERVRGCSRGELYADLRAAGFLYSVPFVYIYSASPERLRELARAARRRCWWDLAARLDRVAGWAEAASDPSRVRSPYSGVDYMILDVITSGFTAVGTITHEPSLMVRP